MSGENHPGPYGQQTQKQRGEVYKSGSGMRLRCPKFSPGFFLHLQPPVPLILQTTPRVPMDSLSLAETDLNKQTQKHLSYLTEKSQNIIRNPDAHFLSAIFRVIPPPSPNAASGSAFQGRQRGSYSLMYNINFLIIECGFLRTYEKHGEAAICLNIEEYEVGYTYL